MIPDYTFKILMLGSASTGKTTLSERYITGLFNPNIKLTVGVEFYVKTVEIKDKHGDTKQIKLQIWDLGGESRFRFLLPTYCLGSSGAFFLFDLTRPDTLLSLDSWIKIVREKNGDSLPIILVGNKADLEEARKVTSEIGVQTAHDNKMVQYLDVSAKSGDGVDTLFETITQIMLEQAFR